MRNFNKLLSLALAVLMVLSVCSVLTAAEETTLVPLPEGAIAIDNIGYRHDSFSSIMGGDGLKVSDFAAYEEDGTAKFKDMNWAKVVLVDRYDIVTEVRTELGRPEGVKSDMTCPKGGYLISYNGKRDGADAIDTIEVGDKITLYNVDRALFPDYIGKDNYVEIPQAGFVVEKPQNIAAGKTYTTFGTVPADSTWVQPEGEYPITDGLRAVDGVGANSLWTAFITDSPDFGEDKDNLEKIAAEVTFDLGGTYKMNKFVLQYRDQSSWGIGAPAQIDVFVNDENVGSMTLGTTEDEINDAVLEAEAIGRKVTFKAKFSNTFIFVSEIEAFGHEIVEKNVSLGKPYTITGLYPNAEAPQYPDTDNKELTNGTKVPADGSPSNSEWVGFNAGSTDYDAVAADKIRNDITVDLGGEYAMSKFSYQYLDGVWGIAGPGELEIFVDGVLVGRATKGSAPIDEAVLVLDKPAIGSVVTFSSTYAPNWVFVSEVEVFGYEIDNDNVALGKPYTKAGLYPNAEAPQYPDTDDKELTDGVFYSGGSYSAPEWVGLNSGADEFVGLEDPTSAMEVTIDLGGLYKVTDLAVEVGNLGAGIYFPDSVEYFISDNGEDWTSLGMGTAGDTYFENSCEKVTLDGVATIGRYVKAVFTRDGWVFISEFEVFGHEAQKPMTVELPGDAITINNIGYHHVAKLVQVIAGNDKTVDTLCGGKDLNYNRIIVVDSEGIVVKTSHKIGRPDGVKSDVKCPAGGYILCLNEELPIAGELIQNQNAVADTIHPGDHITLYNIYLREVRAHRGEDDFTDVENAGFTVESFSVDGKMLPITTINGKLPPETNGLFTKYTATAEDVETYGTAWTKFRRLWHIDGNVYRVADEFWAFGGNVAPLDEGDAFLAVACNGAEGAANLFGNYVAYGLKKGDFIKIVGDITEDGEADAAAHIYIIRPDPDFVPVEFEKTEGEPKLQKGDWAGLDALLDGDLAEDITGYEGNQGKLVAIQNPARANEAAKYNLVFNFKDGKTANTAKLYILNYSSGCVGLPESVTVTINGETFEATVEPEDGKINVLTASFGKDMTFTKAVITVVNPQSDVCSSEFNCFSEVVFASETAEQPPVGGDTSEGDTSEGDTSEGDTSEGDTSEGDTSEGDTSEGDTSEGDTSGTTSAEPTPETGDVGIVLFVILAGVALAVAVIIRKRA